jgi:hypothetical protein
MKLLRFSATQLQGYVLHSLFPEHVKHFFFRMLEENHMNMPEYLSSIFNLGYIPHYESMTPGTAHQHEYDGVLRDFDQFSDQLRETEIYTIYGIEPLDAIYRHSAYASGYDGFNGHFFDDLYSLMETVDPDSCMDYMQDITTLARYLVEVIERFYVTGVESMDAIYIAVNSTPQYLTVLVR